MEGEAQVRLVFAGEVLDGFQPAEVKRRFGEAFKIEGVRLAAMFSGERTVLKRSLPAGEGARYVAKLATLGNGLVPVVTLIVSSYDQHSERAAQHLSSPAALDAHATYVREPNQKAFATGGGGAFGWHAGQASQREAMSRALSACDTNRKPYTTECRLVNVNGAWPKEQ